MKKLLVLVACFMFVGASSFAEPVQDRELGVEMSYIYYEEPNVMEEKGVMYGLFGSYTYRNSYMLRGEARFGYGQVDYENSGTLDNINDYVWEFRGLGGYDFPVFKTTTLTPYIGFGHRYLNDDTSGMTSSTGAKGYERESNYWYSPIGIETMTPLENGWTFGIVLEYDHFWKGIQKSHLSDVAASFSDIENDQDEGWGFRSSVRFQKKSGGADFVIEPFMRYWDIKESETANITVGGALWGFGWEPENDSTEFGIKFIARL